MKNIKFPLLKENQIEVRVGQCSQNGYTLLLYKTSRTDAEILDEVVGMGNWQKRFYTLQGVGIGEQVRSIVVCEVGIYDDDKHEWIWKSDSGTESQVEQDKGICSVAFKRASGGSCWGIGRELYYSGFLFVKGGTKPKANGKGYELVDKYISFNVEKIEWYENPLKLKTLIIKDNNGNVVLTRGVGGKSASNEPKTTKEQGLGNKQNVSMKEISATVTDMGVNTELESVKEYLHTLSQEEQDKFSAWLFNAYGETDVNKLNEEKLARLVNTLRKANKIK